MNRRDGFILLEAVVAMVLTTALAVAALAGVSALQRHAARVGARGEAATTALAALQLLRAELASVAPEAGDLVAASSERLVYRAARGSGVTCGAGGDGVLVRAATWRSLRLPSPRRDTVLVLDPVRGWDARALRGPPRAAACPDGAAALLLPVTPAPDGVSPTAVRIFEVMELRRYRSEGAAWLGLRSVSGGEVIQPVLGPLAPQSGGFTTLDAEARPTGALPGVRHLLVELTLEVPGLAADQVGLSGTLRATLPLRGGPPP